MLRRWSWGACSAAESVLKETLWSGFLVLPVPGRWMRQGLSNSEGGKKKKKKGKKEKGKEKKKGRGQEKKNIPANPRNIAAWKPRRWKSKKLFYERAWKKAKPRRSGRRRLRTPLAAPAGLSGPGAGGAARRGAGTSGCSPPEPLGGNAGSSPGNINFCGRTKQFERAGRGGRREKNHPQNPPLR